MEQIITLHNISKEFKVLNHRQGLKGSIQDIFSKNYRYVKAVDNISMEITRGEIVGYLGPNGAGKSTTIKMMTGILEPSSGEVRVNGVMPYKKREQNAKNIGVVFGQRSQLWWALPLIESFHILKDIYEIKDSDYNDVLELYRSLIDFDSLLNKPVRQMSLGQRTLSDILAAFLHNPSVVFLDEPTIGLDVSMKSKIRELINALNKERKTTVIITTHDMGDVDALCQRIVIIDKGKMLYDNDTEHLRTVFGSYRSINVKLCDNTFTETKINQLYQIVIDNLSSNFLSNIIASIKQNKDYLEILVNEKECSVMSVLNYIQDKYKIYDVVLKDISTESIIKKIYEGGYDETPTL